MTLHGGDVWHVAGRYGIKARDLLDFSANINPRGLPPKAQERLARDAADPRLLTFYPDPTARHLCKALSDRLEVPAESILIGPGAEALLSPILQHLQPKRALVPIPAFSEYRRVCEQLRIEFIPLLLNRDEFFCLDPDRLRAQIASQSPDLILLNNPHNPTGATHPAPDTSTTLFLDEAFIDYIPEATMVRKAAITPNLIVLRSLTKFYGCPALRVGYAVAHPDTVESIRSWLPTWPITQLALDALTEALADREYAKATLIENNTERKHLAQALRNLGLFVFPSAANYLFIELNPNMPAAADLRTSLIANHRILIRNCDSYEGLTPGRYIRAAVRTASDNHSLTNALARQRNA